jgi:hypothetical protein
MDLINQLVASLGVSEEQAKGGAGMLFQLAKDKLSGGEFAQISDQVSGVDDMLSAAPSAQGGGGLMGALGGAVSSLGGGAGGLGTLASLAGGFDKLGMDTGMIGKFVPVVLDFVRKQGGDSVGRLLEGVLSPN